MPKPDEKEATATRLVCNSGEAADELKANVCSAEEVHLQPGSEGGEAQSVSTHAPEDLKQDKKVEQDKKDGTCEAIQEALLGERYSVRACIGSGGMATVFKVWDNSLNKEFAVKLLNASLVEDASSLKRFELEAKAASSLNHPNLVTVYDFGVSTDGRPFIVMDYLEGANLADIVEKEGFMPFSRALHLFVQCAESMAYAHGKGIIHRDVKPSNIVVEKDDMGNDFVKLVDFGIAKVVPSHQTVTSNLTQTGDIFGSPLYMSPEQCQGNVQDSRSDIYSFGCVMYEVLTGEKPFAAANPIKTILKHINDEPTPISALHYNYGVPKDLEYIVMRCLQKSPDDRYETADELWRDLLAIQNGTPIRRKKCITKDEKEALLVRKIESERIAAMILFFQILPLAFLWLGLPGYIYPFLHNHIALLIFFALIIWEGLGIYWRLYHKPRSEFRATMQWFFILVFFVFPAFLAPVIGPGAITVWEALQPVIKAGGS